MSYFLFLCCFLFILLDLMVTHHTIHGYISGHVFLETLDKEFLIKNVIQFKMSSANSTNIVRLTHLSNREGKLMCQVIFLSLTCSSKANQYHWFQVGHTFWMYSMKRHDMTRLTGLYPSTAKMHAKTSHTLLTLYDDAEIQAFLRSCRVKGKAKA